jgi:hypothetical protein
MNDECRTMNGKSECPSALGTPFIIQPSSFRIALDWPFPYNGARLANPHDMNGAGSSIHSGNLLVAK